MEFLAVRPRVGLRAHGDHQLAVLDVRILRAIGVVLQFVIPQPFPPMSYVHFDASGSEPFFPLNSSLQTNVYPFGACTRPASASGTSNPAVMSKMHWWD